MAANQIPANATYTVQTDANGARVFRTFKVWRAEGSGYRTFRDYDDALKFYREEGARMTVIEETVLRERAYIPGSYHEGTEARWEPPFGEVDT